MSKGVVLVTGGSRGIGAEIAVASANAGYDVAIGYVDAKKQKRVSEVLDRIQATGAAGVAIRADLTDLNGPATLLQEARGFANQRNRVLSTLVLNAAGGLEVDTDETQAFRINATGPLMLTGQFLVAAYCTQETDTKTVVYVTSNPSHFYDHPNNVMPSDSYDIVARTKNYGEKALRERLAPGSYDAPNRLLVATADLVDGTAGATMLRMVHRRQTGDRTADLLAERNQQLQELIGRGVTTATEFGGAIVGMFDNPDLPSGHTLYIPRPVLGEYIVPGQQLPYGLGADGMHTFVS